jgi:hypothetical protein
MVHGLPFMVLVLLQLERVGFLVVVTMVVFVEVALVGKLFWIVLSRLFAHVLVFEFQVGDLKNIWLIDSGDKGWFSTLGNLKNT